MIADADMETVAWIVADASTRDDWVLRVAEQIKRVRDRAIHRARRRDRRAHSVRLV
jgi:hypothetical protein